MSAIAQYSKREWGIAQQRRYAALLQDGLDRLAAFPELGEMRDDLAPGVRSMRVEFHVVYHRATPKTIRVLRIRYERNHPLPMNDL